MKFLISPIQLPSRLHNRPVMHLTKIRFPVGINTINMISHRSLFTGKVLPDHLRKSGEIPHLPFPQDHNVKSAGLHIFRNDQANGRPDAAKGDCQHEQNGQHPHGGTGRVDLRRKIPKRYQPLFPVLPIPPFPKPCHQKSRHTPEKPEQKGRQQQKSNQHIIAFPQRLETDHAKATNTAQDGNAKGHDRKPARQDRRFLVFSVITEQFPQLQPPDPFSVAANRIQKHPGKIKNGQPHSRQREARMQFVGHTAQMQQHSLQQL